MGLEIKPYTLKSCMGFSFPASWDRVGVPKEAARYDVAVLWMRAKTQITLNGFRPWRKATFCGGWSKGLYLLLLFWRGWDTKHGGMTAPLGV